MLLSSYKGETQSLSLPLCPWAPVYWCDWGAEDGSQDTKYPVCSIFNHSSWCHLYHTYAWLKTCLKYLAHPVYSHLSALMTTVSSTSEWARSICAGAPSFREVLYFIQITNHLEHH